MTDTKKAETARDSLLVRIATWFFVNWRFTLLLWITFLGAGTVTYTSIIQREGFPSIQFPLTVVRGTYFVDDKQKVDDEIVKPLSKILANSDKVESSQLVAGDNFFSLQVRFNSSVSPQEGTSYLEDTIGKSNLPPQAQLTYITIDPAAFLNRYDMLLSVYSTDQAASAQTLQSAAESIADELKQDPNITQATVESLISSAVNPATGQAEQRQVAFSRLGISQSQSLEFFPSITIGLDRDASKMDIIEFSEYIKQRLQDLNVSNLEDIHVVIGADFAENITTQVNSLQTNLRDGLIAVAFVSLLLITWRASIITGLFMITVMAIVTGILYIVGYSLNTITLFALVLSLGLFVDDATIVVEAIDANRKSKKSPLQVIRESIRRVGMASMAGTLTTVLVFLPLVFIKGILGEFIRLMPVTIILSLLTSLALSLTVIPLLSRFFLLKKSHGNMTKVLNPVAKIEARVARFAGSLPRLLGDRPTVGKLVAVVMVGVSFGFIALAMVFAQKLTFNIFPPSKDSDQIGVQLTFPQGTSLREAETTVDQVGETISREVGGLTHRVTYGSFEQPNERGADALIELVPFTQRSEKSPELIDRLQHAFDTQLANKASVRVIQYDAGPPPDEYPFKIQIYTEDEAAAMALQSDLLNSIKDVELTRQNGTTARITKVKGSDNQTIARKDGRRVFQLQAAFDSDDVSALVTSAETYTKEKLTPDYLNRYGLNADQIGYDFGQESENEDSFSSLGLIFPLALGLMYLLLAFQFRSFLQPILIFMAIPFSLFGVFVGLFVTDNALSFFSMIGLIGLVGIAVNNAILLTDYANQERRIGLTPNEAISNALMKRFRPLLATTLTTVVALLPLALSDPFWEALAYTIIFGLLSSTFLVIFSFPYYYLGSEWLRSKFRRR